MLVYLIRYEGVYVYVTWCLVCTNGIDAVGQYTYWSQRTFARPVNKGLRLDYFICSDDMFSNSPSSDVVQVLDSYVLHEDTIGTSDHCPVALLLELPQ